MYSIIAPTAVNKSFSGFTSTTFINSINLGLGVTAIIPAQTTALSL
ncbi:hypothetical protein [Chryseobacterium sp. StRB126]|nr:hypothetical protein [Chryseobacterium sp. StRB126]